MKRSLSRVYAAPRKCLALPLSVQPRFHDVLYLIHMRGRAFSGS